ncbi:imidazole glycerol phosphate synthase subunit HisH [Deltaproteobacteria bacterium PRO3]|nr:imidazole glycerol phosphate synthase subunit HisH [Deltaproteobacteria bacterium PRO3]
MIAILDYDMGNLRSVSKAVEDVGGKCAVTRDPKRAAKADKLILPGVGAFKDCMANLESYGLIEPIREFIASGRPFLGICLGMQLLMDESEEGGRHRGLGILPGKVRRFSPELGLKVPHMGWNRLKLKGKPRLLEGMEGDYVYFVHSYYVAPEKKKAIAAVSDYGLEFAASLESDNIFATQFHPEKSQKVGLGLLKRFVKL